MLFRSEDYKGHTGTGVADETARSAPEAASTCTGEFSAATGTSESVDADAVDASAPETATLGSAPVSDMSGSASSMKRVRGGTALTNIHRSRSVMNSKAV